MCTTVCTTVCNPRVSTIQGAEPMTPSGPVIEARPVLPGPPMGGMFPPGMAPMGAPHPGMMGMHPGPHMPPPMVGHPYAPGVAPQHGAPPMVGGPHPSYAPAYGMGHYPYGPPPVLPPMGMPQGSALPKTRSTPLRAAATPFVPANLRGTASEAAAPTEVERAVEPPAADAPAVPSSPNGSVEPGSDGTQQNEASVSRDAAEPSPPSGRRRKVLKAGGLLVEGLEDDLKRLKLVRWVLGCCTVYVWYSMLAEEKHKRCQRMSTLRPHQRTTGV